MSDAKKSVLWRAGLGMSIGILAGRAAGFVREASIAAGYGAGENADIAVLMLAVPDLLVNILVGGALSVALVPELKKLGEKDAGALFMQASFLVCGMFVLLVLLLAGLPSQLIHVLVPGFSSESVARAAPLVRFTLWVIPLTTLAGVTAAYSQAYERFVVPAFGTLIFNCVVAGGLIIFRHSLSLFSLAAFVIVAALVRWLSQVFTLPRLAFDGRVLRKNLISSDLIRHYFQALAAGVIILLFPVLARGLASFQHTGAVAILNYANKLVEFPLGVSITVLSILLFPRLAEAFAKKGESREFESILRKGIPLVYIVSVGMMLSLCWFSPVLSSLAFGWGKMPHAVVQEIGTLAGIGLLSLPAQGLSSLVVAAFNARRGTLGPLLMNVFGLSMFAILGWYLARPFGLRGLMAAMTLSMWAMAAGQTWLLARRHKILVWPILYDRQIFAVTLAQVGFAAAVGSLAAVLPQNIFLDAGLAACGCLLSITAGLWFTEWRAPLLHFMRGTAQI